MAEASARGKRVRWSRALGDRIIRRIEAGAFLHRICAEPRMPSAEAVMQWARSRPEFGARLAAARAAGPTPTGRSTYSEGVAQEIFERVCDGEALTRIGDDPSMPSTSTIFKWRRDLPAFETMMRLAMRIRAERLCDLGWEMAQAADAKSAYATDVKLKQLRWMTGVLAPRTFRARLAEPDTPPRMQTILFRHFRVEEDPETGRPRVVAYCPNPLTGQLERETEDWVQSGDEDTISLPGGRRTGEGW